jgi:hypothetical protein
MKQECRSGSVYSLAPAHLFLFNLLIFVIKYFKTAKNFCQSTPQQKITRSENNNFDYSEWIEQLKYYCTTSSNSQLGNQFNLRYHIATTPHHFLRDIVKSSTLAFELCICIALNLIRHHNTRGRKTYTSTNRLRFSSSDAHSVRAATCF